MESFKAINLSRIQGYRTIRVDNADIPHGPYGLCMLYVDVAGGQSLRVETGPNDEDEAPSCDIARRYADAAVTTLAEQTA